MENIPETRSISYREFIASVCACLAPTELTEWLPEGVIRYRDVCFFIQPDQSRHIPRLSVVIDLGEIAPARRLDALRHMASCNLERGGNDHGVLGLNFFSPDCAMHRLSFPQPLDLRADEFARTLHALSAHALDFRASYGKRNHANGAGFFRLHHPPAYRKGTTHGG